MRAWFLPFDDVIAFAKLNPFAEIDDAGLVAHGNHVNAALGECRDVAYVG